MSHPPARPVKVAAPTGRTCRLQLWRAFGGNLTPEQANAILTFAAVAVPIVTALMIRFNVYSPATVERLLGHKPPGSPP